MAKQPHTAAQHTTAASLKAAPPERIESLSLQDIQSLARDSEQGKGLSDAAAGALPAAAQGVAAELCDVTALSDDLILSRADVSHVPEEAHATAYSIDYRGWLFLHFRLDGLSREQDLEGREVTLGSHSFLLTASSTPAAGMRQVLGENWRTVGIACRPSFISRELGLSDEALPDALRRFQDGDTEADFWFAGAMSKEMLAVASSLLDPAVRGGMREVYLRAKSVELVCLAVDSVGLIDQAVEPTVRLTRNDIRCLHEAHEILEEVTEAPSLDELARRVGLNRNKLAAGFKHVFGETVGAYHRGLRLERAYQRIEAQESSIGRIAQDAGYLDAGSFSKAFKQRFGLLPSEVKPFRGRGVV